MWPDRWTGVRDGGTATGAFHLSLAVEHLEGVPHIRSYHEYLVTITEAVARALYLLTIFLCQPAGRTISDPVCVPRAMEPSERRLSFSVYPLSP